MGEGDGGGPRPGSSSAIEVLRRLTAGRDRLLLGLTGPPGAGKSAFAAQLTQEWAGTGRSAVVVGTDGFHLGNEVLATRGLADVKGAPETFDPERFVALLRRLSSRAETVVRAPGFDRAREQTVADAIEITAAVGLVVVEGNYLLLDGPWRPVRDLLDEVWYLDLPDDVRVGRLVSRHAAHGRTPDEARAWVQRSDEANARLVAATRALADRVVDADRQTVDASTTPRPGRAKPSRMAPDVDPL